MWLQRHQWNCCCCFSNVPSVPAVHSPTWRLNPLAPQLLSVPNCDDGRGSGGRKHVESRNGDRLSWKYVRRKFKDREKQNDRQHYQSSVIIWVSWILEEFILFFLFCVWHLNTWTLLDDRMEGGFPCLYLLLWLRCNKQKRLKAERAYNWLTIPIPVYHCGKPRQELQLVTSYPQSRAKKNECIHAHLRACAQPYFHILMELKTLCLEDGDTHSGLGLPTWLTWLKQLTYRNAHKPSQWGQSIIEIRFLSNSRLCQVDN